MKITDKSFLISILCFMSLFLWLGHVEYVQQTWMLMGAGAAPFIILMLMDYKRSGSIHYGQLFPWLGLAIYMIHQFEEHGVDIYGNQFAFSAFVNHFAGGLLGCGENLNCPTTPENLLYINIWLVWLPFLLAAYKNRNMFPTACAIGIIFSNACLHTIVSLKLQAYNPGVLTALLLFWPFSLYFYKLCLKRDWLTKKGVILSVMYGFLTHAILASSLAASYVHHLIPTTSVPFIYIACAFIPLAIVRFRRAVQYT